MDTREVDSALLQLDEVREAATVARNESDEHRLVAFVVFKQGCQLDASALRERLREYLPEWKIPVRFQSISSLPTTLTGKVDKQRLEKDVAYPSTLESSGTETPLTIEGRLAEIWKTTLRLDAVGHDDNFLDLGGDSISTMISVKMIERRYGIRVPHAEFFQNATIRKLADRIRRSISTEDRSPTDHKPRARFNSRTQEHNRRHCWLTTSRTVMSNCSTRSLSTTSLSILGAGPHRSWSRSPSLRPRDTAHPSWSCVFTSL